VIHQSVVLESLGRLRTRGRLRPLRFPPLAAPSSDGDSASERVVLSVETPARCTISCTPWSRRAGRRRAADPL